MTRGGRLLAVALAAAASLAPAGDTRADDAAAARFFDQLARRDFALRRYGRALESFLESYRSAPNPRTAFNVAVAARQASEPAMALNFYIEYLDTAPADEARRRSRARRAIEELRERTAVVRVETEPAGARVRVNRAERAEHGRTPRLLALEPGERRLIVELDGYRAQEVVVRPEVGVERAVRLQLEPITTTLRVDAEPSTAEVVVLRDGEEVARGDAPFERELPVGRYRVRVEAEDYLPNTSNVLLREGDEARLRLTARAGPGAAARLLVSTGAVIGAEVRVDGRWVGRTPLTIPRAMPGERRLEVRAEGYRPWTARVTLERGGAVHVPVRLEAE